MCRTTYEVLEFNPETGEVDGVFLTTALGPTTKFNAAELICRFDDVRDLGRAFFIELEATYATAH